MRLAQEAGTTSDLAELEERRNAFCRRLSSWVEARNLYIPPTSEEQAIDLASEPLNTADRPPEAVPLGLPSSLPTALHASCPFNLAKIEFRFRLAQAEDALSELRRLLRVTLGLRDYKSKQIGPSQRSGTRARNLIQRFQDKVTRYAGRYRSAHTALLSLDGEGEWKHQLRQLLDTDVRPPGRAGDESEGNRELSWIWLVTPQARMEGASALELSEPLRDNELDNSKWAKRLPYALLTLALVGLRCEWAKSKARVDRWDEEVQLVREEMRRVLAFLEWKACWWDRQREAQLIVSYDIQEGAHAYAAKQAHVNRALAASFEDRWRAELI